MRLHRILLLSLMLIFTFLIGVGADYYFKIHRKEKFYTSFATIEDETLTRLKIKTAGLPAYAKANGFNVSICFIADMHIASGKKRFFIYDLDKQNILLAGMVTHGCCNQTWLHGRKYSNTPGSGCTSIGKYRIGKAYYGRFGLAYKLHGLDTTNSNAFNRFVVLHAMECVPEAEVNPYPICQSDGCPAVSPMVIEKLQQVIDKSSKPILLQVME